MLLAIVICSTIALCIGNPLHKYPYVFLLDVGNEELEKTNTEQLRVSIPGGSLAMKYPAMGEGDPISHVRVSGIDFGTDLKVNIVEGGPGYKYVVLMFMGNPGITYDAVVTLQTLQTLPSVTEMSLANTNKFVSTENSNDNSYEVTDADNENNDQDSINDLKNRKAYNKKSKEVMQSSSTFYNYAKGERMADDDKDKESENVSAEEQDDNDDDDDSANEEDEEENTFSNNGNQRPSNEDKPEFSNQEDSEVFDGEEDENQEDDSVNAKLIGGQIYDHLSDIPRAEQYRYNVNLNNEDNAKPDIIYDKYQEVKPHFGFRVYPQSFIYNKRYQVNSPYNKEDPVEFEQVFNDEEVHNDSRFKDGSNSIDPDYLVAEY